MRMRLLTISALTAWLLFGAAAHAVNAFGTITTATWTAENSPYRVTGTITVPEGNTLTIEAGVDVLFDADVQFIVKGALRVCGTETDSVRFLKGTAEEWGGVRISAGGNNSLMYARISDAYAEGTTSGGGLACDGVGARLAMLHCVVSSNRASMHGGGLSVSSPSGVTTLVDCTIRQNTAEYDGGGISNGSGAYNGYACMYLINCVLEDNECLGGGGGMRNVDAEAILIGCTFTGNTAEMEGGGLWDNHATATLENCLFIDNDGGHDGGAIAQSSSTGSVSLANCTLSGNTAIVGGGISSLNGRVFATGCFMTGNTATGAGGAISASGGVVSASVLELASCTIADNSAADFGGGIVYSLAPITATDCILWGNAPEQMSGENSTVTVTYSCVQGGSTTDGNIVADPLFVDATNGDYGLQAASPCIDAGDPASPLDADGTRADMGASMPDYGDPPVWEPRADTTVDIGQELVFAVSATDPEGNSLAYVPVLLPDGAAFDDSSRQFSWTPSSSQAGTEDIVFCVTDGHSPVLDTVSVTVNAAVSVSDAATPSRMELLQNAPNPFNPITTLRFGLPEAGEVQLVIYDMLGRPMRTLLSGVAQAGEYSLVWDGRDDAGRVAASGVYVYRLRTNGGTLVRRMTLVR